MRRMDEGCLSFPGVTGTVARAAEVTIEFTDLSGARRSRKVAGVTAQAVQHELDHLDGVLFVDRLSVARKAVLAAKLRAVRQRGRRGEHR